MRKNLYISHPLAIEKLKSVENKSRYVTKLILKDIEQPQETIDRNEVIKIVQEFIGNKKNEIDPDLRKSISSMLDI